MHPYIEDWLKIIDGMNNENTYKLAWGRALVEICHEMNEPFGSLIDIQFNSISEKILKYYWNQTYFFKLYQGPAKSKPIIQKIVEEMIEHYQKETNSTLPIWFDDALKTFLLDGIKYENFITKTSVTLKSDVSHRFLKANGENINLYGLDLTKRTVTFTREQIYLLKDHAFVLSQLLNYRWAQLLEKFNTSPRIAMKVKGISEEKIRRNSLAKFKQALLKQFPDGIVKDFYTDEVLDPNDISIDHVIPWSFMYSDDIWNLVITSKSRNSSKSNNTISKQFIDKLKERNQILKEIVEDNYKMSLLEAEDMKFVDRYYFEFRI